MSNNSSFSKIIKLDPSYDLWLSYSWSGNNHGICGHIFEVIDYFHILSKKIKVGILLAEKYNWKIFEKCIESKYCFDEKELKHIKENTFFVDKPSLVTGKNILFTDGGVTNLKKVTLLFDNILHFACGNKDIKYNNKLNTWILQDDRVYEPVKVNGINYKKKILFHKLKTLKKIENNFLVYATKNCRSVSDFKPLSKYSDNIIVITNEENKLSNMKGFSFLIPPVEDLFEKFSTYIYTPIERKWDCSPRFIAECKYYQKKVIFHNIDYWHIDKGLYWRNWDIENDFNSLFLNENDEIFSILEKIIT